MPIASMRLITGAFALRRANRASLLGGGKRSFLSASCLCAAIVALCSAAPAPNALPGTDEKWHYVTSAHFEAYSCEHDDATRDILHNLEVLRAVFFETLKFQERRRLDVTLFVFRSHRDFKAYVPEAMRANDSIAGFYSAGPDRATIVLAPAEDSDFAQKTIFHEYVHHLFHLAEQDPPLWFNEGTADVLGGMSVEPKRVLIGTPMEQRVRYLRMESLIPLDELFAADHNSRWYKEEDHMGVFYSESWALMHFLRFGDSGFSRDAVERFLRVAGNAELAAATDLRKHFKTCFGCDYPEMMRRLEAYIHSGRYSSSVYPMPKLPPVSTYAIRAVPADELTARLGELSLRVTHSGIGKLALLNALTQRPKDTRPLEALGAEAIFERDEREAAERWEQALALGSTNAAMLRELALMEGQQWFANYDGDFKLPEDAANRMRERLLRSIEIEPQQAASYEMLMWVEAFSDPLIPKNINRLIEHLPALPDKRHTLVALAHIMLRLRKPKDAQLVLDHLQSIALEPRDGRAASELRAKFEALFPDHPSTIPTKPSPGAQMIAPPPAKAETKVPSIALPDDL